MSRIGKKPINIPAGVTVDIAGNCITVKGSVGELKYDFPETILVKVDGNICNVERCDETKKTRSLHGLVRSLIANMVEGVSAGFKKELEIEGVGFKAEVQGQKIILNVGFSIPMVYVAPDGVKLEEKGGTKITISGADKQKVGEAAARIRGFAPAEPYKGKGVKYKGERIRRKVGKTVA
jgi:large subunit ribosomal protein L6